MSISLSLLLLALLASPIEPGLTEPEEEAGVVPTAEPAIGIDILCGRGEYRLEDGSKPALLHARDLFEFAVEVFPQEGCAHAGLSRALLSIYLRHIEPEDETLRLALKEAEEAVRVSPLSPESHAALATALMADLRISEAEEHATAALDQDPGSVMALHAAALVRIALDMRASAREATDRALELRPDLPSLHLLDGNLHLLERRPFEAIRAYRRALLMSPDFLPAAFQQAAAYEYTGDYRTAASIFERLLDEHPDEETAIVHLYMGQSLMQRRSWRAALAVLEKADFKRSKGVCNGTVLYLRAHSLEELGRTSEAIEAHRTIISDWPDATRSFIDPGRLLFESYMALGRLHLEADEPEEALGIMEEGARRPDAPIELLIRLARLYDQYRLHSEAYAILETAAGRELTGRNARDLLDAYVMWARIAADSPEPGQAQAVAVALRSRSEAISRMGDFSHDVQMARAFSIAGDVDGSIDSLEMAVRHGYTHLGWIADDPEFAAIRRSKRYRTLLATAEGSGRK